MTDYQEQVKIFEECALFIKKAIYHRNENNQKRLEAYKHVFDEYQPIKIKSHTNKDIVPYSRSVNFNQEGIGQFTNIIKDATRRDLTLLTIADKNIERVEYAIKELYVQLEHPENKELRSLEKDLKKVNKILKYYHKLNGKVGKHLEHEVQLINKQDLSEKDVRKAKSEWEKSLRLEKKIIRELANTNEINKHLHKEGRVLGIAATTAYLGGLIGSIHHASLEADFSTVQETVMHHVHGVGVVGAAVTGAVLAGFYIYHFFDQQYKQSLEQILHEVEHMR